MKFLVSMILIFSSTLLLSQNKTDFAPGQLVVRMNGDLYSKCDSILTKHNKNAIEVRNTILSKNRFMMENQIIKVERLRKGGALQASKDQDFNRSFVLHSEEKDILTLMDRLNSSTNIEFAHPNFLFHTTQTPDDPKYCDQWALPKISMPDAWTIQTGCENIPIAILDAGFNDLAHNDVNDKFLSTRRDETDINLSEYISDGYTAYLNEDYEDPDNNPEGKSYHGLKVSSVAAAETNNDNGMAGIGWNNTIVPIRCGFAIKKGGDELGLFEYDDIIRAIDWVIDNNVSRIINMSLSYDSDPAPQEYTDFEDVLEDAFNAGIVIICSSGNYKWQSNPNDHDVQYPASSEFTISVGASVEDDTRGPFSSYGPELDLVAPGRNIVVAYKNIINKYLDNAYGTSFSAPLVSGLVALLFSQNPHLSVGQIESVLICCTDEVSNMNGQEFHQEYGYGRINAKTTLEAVPLVCANQLIENMSIDKINIVHAVSTITVKDYVVQSGACADFKAGSSIILDDGFQIESGAEFQAEISTVQSINCQ